MRLRIGLVLVVVVALSVSIAVPGIVAGGATAAQSSVAADQGSAPPYDPGPGRESSSVVTPPR